jgi:DtxR family Mn-dependent transcriptional regulator
MKKKTISSTMEDYLKAMLLLEKDKKAVRVKDIAQKMSVKLPTVTSMLNTLAKRDLINHERYEYVELTKQGKRVAEEVHRRHIILCDFLTNILNIDTKISEKDACKMEHAISTVTLDRIVKFMEFVETCPRGGSDWLKRFNDYQQHGRSDSKCLEQMQSFVKKSNIKIKELKNKTG